MDHLTHFLFNTVYNDVHCIIGSKVAVIAMYFKT